MIYVLPPQHDEEFIQFPEYRYTLELDGQEYTFVLRWYERQGYWFLSLFDADGLSIARNIKMVVNTPLLRGVVGRRLGLIDTTGKNTEAGFLDLGKSHKLMWMDQLVADRLQVLLSDDYGFVITI